jgi:hypothetical protein
LHSDEHPGECESGAEQMGAARDDRAHEREKRDQEVNRESCSEREEQRVPPRSEELQGCHSCECDAGQDRETV